MFRVGELTSFFLTRRIIVPGLFLLLMLMTSRVMADEQAASSPPTNDGATVSVDLDTTIDAVNTMVNGISAQLLETSGVRQKTIIQVLNDASAMLAHTVDLFGKNPSDKKDLYELIEVDIRLYISASYSASGDYGGAREQIKLAKELFAQLCDEGRKVSRACTLSSIRIKITWTEQLLLQRPETGAGLASSSKTITKALDQLSKLIKDEQKRQPVNQNILNELQTLGARAQVIAVRTLVRHALILQGAEKNKKVGDAEVMAKKCVQSLSASATDNDDIREALGSCTNLQALALHILDRQPKIALEKAHRAGSTLADLARRRVENIPLALEHIYARLYLGLMLHKTASLKGTDLGQFMTALKDFKRLITINPDNYMLRSRYIQLSGNLTNGSWFDQAKSGSDFYKLLVEVLENRADYLTGRLNRLAELSDKVAPGEAAILRDELAKTLEELLFRYYLGDKKNAIIKRFREFKSLLPLPKTSSGTSIQGGPASAEKGDGDASLFSDAYMSSTMEVYYWVARALRDEDEEKQAMQAFLILEEHSGKLRVPDRSRQKNSSINRSVFMYFYAFAIRSLGAFDLEEARKQEVRRVRAEDLQYGEDGDQQLDIENLLAQARKRIEKAVNRDSRNPEFRYAQAQITYKHGRLMENRKLLDQAGESYRRATDLGSQEAAKRLSKWYRTATGPMHQKDPALAERYTQISRRSSVLEHRINATSTILTSTKKFTIYLLPGRTGKSHIRAEKRRLQDYYGVENIDPATEARLGDLYANAIRRAGDAARMTIKDLEESDRALKVEKSELTPFEGSDIEKDLMASRNELENGDHAKALAKLEAAEILSSPHLGVLENRALEDLGIAALQFLRIAEVIDSSNGGSSVSDRAKKASRRALRQVLEDSGYDMADCECNHRALVYQRLAIRAYDLLVLAIKDGNRVSFEPNVDYTEKYSDITNRLIQRAIDTTIAFKRVRPGYNALDKLADLYRVQGLYYYGTSGINSDQSEREKLLKNAMNAFNNGQSMVSQLRQSDPSSQTYQSDDITLSLDVVDVHISYGERGVALRLIRDIVEDMKTLMDSRDERSINVNFMKTAAAVYVKGGSIERADAEQRVTDYNSFLNLRKYLIKNRKDFKNFFARLERKKARLEVIYKNAIRNYEDAAKLYKKIIDADPEEDLKNAINNNIRTIVDLKKWYAINLFDKDKGGEQFDEVKIYLDEQVKHWKDKVEKAGNGPEVRQFKWFYSRTLALRADLEREFPHAILSLIEEGYEKRSKKALSTEQLAYIVPQKSYEEARKSFESMSHMSDIMKADYALFLNDLGFFYLMNNKDADAIEVLKKAYSFWKKLPYGVWAKLKVSDLNIPANYAHSLFVQKDDRQAMQIYRKYKRRAMRLWKPGRTWNDLIVTDLINLNSRRRAKLEVDDIVRELRSSASRTASR